MSEYSDKGPLAARLWLTGLVFCQIFLTPMAAFSITYLIEFEMASENFTMSFQSEMIPWIVAASLAYGMIASVTCSNFWRIYSCLDCRKGWMESRSWTY